MQVIVDDVSFGSCFTELSAVFGFVYCDPPGPSSTAFAHGLLLIRALDYHPNLGLIINGLWPFGTYHLDKRALILHRYYSL